MRHARDVGAASNGTGWSHQPEQLRYYNFQLLRFFNYQDLQRRSPAPRHPLTRSDPVVSDKALFKNDGLENGGPWWTRTTDQWIKSPLLYQLS